MLRDAIDGDRYFMSPRVRRLKSILAKVDPDRTRPSVEHYPARRPSGEPSFLYHKLRGDRRRR